MGPDLARAGRGKNAAARSAACCSWRLVPAWAALSLIASEATAARRACGPAVGVAPPGARSGSAEPRLR